MTEQSSTTGKNSISLFPSCNSEQKAAALKALLCTVKGSSTISVFSVSSKLAFLLWFRVDTIQNILDKYVA